MRQIFFHCLVAEKYFHILIDKPVNTGDQPKSILTSFNPSWVSPPPSFPSLFPDLISTCQWIWYVLPPNSENISFRFSSLKSLTCFWLTQSAPLPHPPNSSLSYFCFLYSPLTACLQSLGSRQRSTSIWSFTLKILWSFLVGRHYATGVCRRVLASAV